MIDPVSADAGRAAPPPFPPVPPLRGERPVTAAILHALYDLGWLLFAVVGAPWLLWMSLRRPGFATMVVERLGRGVSQNRNFGQAGLHGSLEDRRGWLRCNERLPGRAPALAA